MTQRVAAYSVIIDDHDRLLLTRWVSGRRHMWTLPGGGINPGETPQQAACREAKEETGLRIETGELLGTHSRVAQPSDVSATGASTHLLRIVYRSTVLGGKLRNERNGSSNNARWFSLTDLPPNCTQLVRFALQQRALPQRAQVPAEIA